MSAYFYARIDEKGVHMGAKEIIESGKAYLGIEFGSTESKEL